MRLYLSGLLDDPDEALSLMANDQLPCMVEVKHRHTGLEERADDQRKKQKGKRKTSKAGPVKE